MRIRGGLEIPRKSISHDRVLPHASQPASIRASANPFFPPLPVMKPIHHRLPFRNSVTVCALIIGMGLLTPAANAKSAAEQAGMAPGTVHKVGVGLGVAKFLVIKLGEDGWVMVECQEDNNAGWKAGEKYWLNTKTVVFISAPFQKAAESGTSAKKPATKAH